MKVSMVSATQNPIDTICMSVAIMMYADPVAHVAGMTTEEKYQMIDQVFATKLRGSLEFATFEFHLTGVSRTFTHQLVRHRLFHFSQQSMRFFDASKSEFYNPIVVRDDTHEGEQSTKYNLLQMVAERSIQSYRELIQLGVPIQDARSILPQNITTQIMFGCNFRALVELAEVRMCTQTQGEFRDMMKQIKSLMEEYSPYLASKLKPYCGHHGTCGFQSIYDRKCPNQDKLTNVR